MLVVAFWYYCMSSSLLGTVVTWVCAHKCFRGAGIGSLVWKTFWCPLYPGPCIYHFPFLLPLGVIPSSLCSEANCGLELQWDSEGEEKTVLPRGVYTSWRPLHSLFRPQLFSSRLTHFGIHPLGYFSGLDFNFSKEKNPNFSRSLQTQDGDRIVSDKLP